MSVTWTFASRFGPTSVQLKSEINGAFLCKRHQQQHLEFCTTSLRTRRSGVRVPPGAPLYSFQSLIVVQRFICSVTYFLGRLGHGTAQLVKPRIEVESLSCEPPLERLGNGLVMALEGQQALCQLLQGGEIVGRQGLSNSRVQDCDRPCQTTR